MTTCAAIKSLPRFQGLNLRFGIWDGIHGAKFAVEELEVARLADHGCIVGGIGERRDVHLPTMATTKIQQSIAQSAIGTHATCYGYLVDFEVFGSSFELVDEDVDDGLLQRSTKVSFVLLDEIFVFLEMVAEEI